MIELLKQTNAYKVIKGDKMHGSLSHAYLVECADDDYLRNYLKILAKLILCGDEDFCDNCRVCRLIERETHSDVTFYPPSGEKLNAAMADEIVSSCFVQPLELNKRLFVVCGFDKFEKSQNKLLKTLEEPPKNVILLIGTSNMEGVLPTVKSRAKKVSIPAWSEEQLFDALKGEFEDEQKFRNAVAFSNGLISKVYQNYEQSDFEKLKNLVQNFLAELNSSRDALRVSVMLKDVNLPLFLSVLKTTFGDLLKYKCGDISRLTDQNALKTLDEKYKTGAVVEIIEGIGENERALHFNANQTMTIDRVIFLILEAKHRWLKL